MVISSPDPTLIWSIAGIDLQQMHERVGAIVDMQEFAPRRPASPDRKFPQALRFASWAFLISAGSTWPVLRSKLSPGP